MPNVFAVPVFFIVLRETLETGIIVSILLAFLRTHIGPEKDITLYRKLRNQVWLGTGLGLAICFIIGCGLIGAFYGIGINGWGTVEEIWEGVFSLIASIIISLMGAALLRVSKLQEKWRTKLARVLATKKPASSLPITTGSRIKQFCEKYAMLMLPFITILREGLEAVIFIGGVSLGVPAASIPLPTVLGLFTGTLICVLIYKGANWAPLQVFLIVSTCVLYLVAAGLFTRCVDYFEKYKWNLMTGGDAAENGSGPGSYNILLSVWHVNCCNEESNSSSGWSIFNAILGWTNSATYGTVISYNVYWLAVMVAFGCMMYYEKQGHWPWARLKSSARDPEANQAGVESIRSPGAGIAETLEGGVKLSAVANTSNVDEVVAE